MRKSILTVAGAALLSAGFLAVHAADKPKHSIKEVMEQGFKGKTSAAARVGKGEGTKDDFKLLAELRQRSPAHAQALAEGRALRLAVQQVMAGPDTLLVDGAELGVFPPVTGG